MHTGENAKLEIAEKCTFILLIIPDVSVQLELNGEMEIYAKPLAKHLHKNVPSVSAWVAPTHELHTKNMHIFWKNT